jgi:hypothetical protein
MASPLRHTPLAGVAVKLLFAAVVVFLAGAFVTAGYAYRAPTAAERRQIVAAILDKQRRNNCHSIRTCHPHISHIRVSLANTRYASATLSVRGYPDALALLHKLYGTWRVTDVGSSRYVGCGKAPKAVRVDLELTCPGGK